jgi:hypothetical protein
MLEREFEIVLANRELVRPVTTENIRDGIVRTPVISFESRDGRERIKIWRLGTIRDLHLPATTYLEDLDQVGDFAISRHVGLGESEIT